MCVDWGQHVILLNAFVPSAKEKEDFRCVHGREMSMCQRYYVEVFPMLFTKYFTSVLRRDFLVMPHPYFAELIRLDISVSEVSGYKCPDTPDTFLLTFCRIVWKVGIFCTLPNAKIPCVFMYDFISTIATNISE